MLIGLLFIGTAQAEEIDDAIEAGNLAKVKELLKANPKLIAETNGTTPLHIVAHYHHNNHKQIAEFLLANGADVNAKNRRGATPLHVAARAGQKEVAEFLLANGADIEAKERYGFTPLHLAVQGNHKEIVELLLVNGADVNAVDKGGWTPLRWTGKIGIKDFLSSIGKVSVVNSKVYNSSPMSRVSHKERKEMVKLLRRSVSPMYRVSQEVRKEMVKLLHRYGGAGILAYQHLRAGKQTDIYVGILEYPYEYEVGTLPDDIDRDEIYPYVRVAFRKQGDSWVAMKHGVYDREALKASRKYYPSKINWVIVFDGQQLGRLTSRNPGRYKAYSSIGKHEIVTDLKRLPYLRNNGKFYAWSGTHTHRPLVVVSQEQENYEDPDNWKPAKPTNREIALAKLKFREKVPDYVLRNDDQTEIINRHQSYLDRDIKVFKKAYRSKNGNLIIGLCLNSQLDLVGSTLDQDANWSKHWFYINEEGIVEFIDNHITPLEVGDFDGNGKSEWIFGFSFYASDGYMLFYNDFSQSAAFTWGYH